MIRLSDRGSTPLGTVIGVFVAGALVGALATVEVVPANKAGIANAGGPQGTATTGPQQQTGPVTGPSGGPVALNGQPGVKSNVNGTVPSLPPSTHQCRAGQNGGATDVRGVTANSINLATTIVASGPGKSFLGEMKYAMQAVIEQVNRAGGICGRYLHLDTRDDGWDAQTGSDYLRNYLNDKKLFAIPVGASSEGLRILVDSGDLDTAQFPAVGTDGLAIDQYVRGDGSAQPWVWPVATATVSSARIMADYALSLGAKNPGVVFDNNYRFGKEAAAAFSAEVKRKTGSSVHGENKQNTCKQAYCGITAGQPDYGTQINEFYGDKPDFVALFVEPETGLTWMQNPNTIGANDNTSNKIKFGYSGAQPLFTNQFEAQCREKCDQMVVWSGFKPYVETYRNDPAVAAYVNSLKGTFRQADPYNQFTESAYVGMQLLVKALELCGPDLTRARLKLALDALTFTNQLTLQGTLRYTPQTRFANVTMQAFTMQYKGTPGGWRLGPIKTDPRPQAD